MLQFLVHYSLHLVFPALIAYTFYRDSWKKAYLILLLTMLVDLDHIFATPIFDADRCSIGFHFLHSLPAIAIYIILLFPKKTRIVGLGLILHMITDFIDCLWMVEGCFDCLDGLY